MNDKSDSVLPSQETIRQTLAPLVQSYGEQNCQVQSARLLTGGASALTWILDLQDVQPAEKPARLILRQNLLTEQSSNISKELEFRILLAAVEAGVCAPKPIALLPPDSPLKGGYLMEYLEGEALPPRIFRNPDMTEAKRIFARQCGQQLARIHSMKLEDPDIPRPSIKEMVAALEQGYLSYKTPVPAFDVAFQFLRQNPLPSAGSAFLHGDFRMGNILLDPEGIAGVLDWELAQWGDILQDMGWLCTNSWRFGNRDQEVGGCGDILDLIAGYEEAGGTQNIDVEAIRAWAFYGSLRWGIICLGQGARGTGDDGVLLERLAIGRRVSETELDLVAYLMDRAGLAYPALHPLPTPSSQAAALQARPPQGEQMLHSLATYLRKAKAAADPAESFYQRVAANMLDTVARQMQIAPVAELHLSRQRASLMPEQGLPDEQELCRQIRQDNLHYDSEDLLDYLFRNAMVKVAIDNPKYSTYRTLSES